MLDDQFKYVSTSPQSGAIPVNTAAALSTLGNTGIPITKNGYLYIWVSNETPGWDVFFDNLSVKQYTGAILEETHYYPFGLSMAGISDKAIKTNYAENKFKFNGKELQNKEFSDGSGMEWEDYGARMYDHQIGRWNKIDGKAELYQNISPYVYAANQPTNAINPDGNLVIFINGLAPNGDGGTSGYWRLITPVENGIAIHAFDYGVMLHFSDCHRIDPAKQYLDGSCGGLLTSVNELTADPWASEYLPKNLSAADRMEAGMKEGELDAETILRSLNRTDGVINESLKIVSHSMGAAYAKGYIKAIVEYAKKHPELSNGLRISEYDFDPFEAGALTPEPRVHTEQKTHNRKKHGGLSDRIADQKQNGLNGTEWNAKNGDNNSYTESNTRGEHSIFSFFNEIFSLDEGTYNLINGQWVKQ